MHSLVSSRVAQGTEDEVPEELAVVDAPESGPNRVLGEDKRGAVARAREGYSQTEATRET